MAVACLGEDLDELERLANRKYQAYSLRREGSPPRSPKAPLRGELFAGAQDRFLLDKNGRRLLLRGVSIGGAAKVPTCPEGATHLQGGLDASKPVSFVGRPLGPTLADAELHLKRLRAWGFTFIRLVVPWEAVEHSGPGEYDQAYLEYLRGVVRKCAEHGLSVYIDPHQDCWSRFSGGDGAPRWTLELLGMDPGLLDEAMAAMTHERWGDDFVPMSWRASNQLLAASTMWTVFFAGDLFAPKATIRGEPAQEFLQRHYCSAMQRIAVALRDEPNVLGFNAMSGPGHGFIGKLLDIPPTWTEEASGPCVSPFEAMLLGAGFMVEAPFKHGGGEPISITMNSTETCCWVGGPEACIWRKNGVWDIVHGEPRLLDASYFLNNPRTGQNINAFSELLTPFWKRVAEVVRTGLGRSALIFTEPFSGDTSMDGYPPPEYDGSWREMGCVSSRDEGFVWSPQFFDEHLVLTRSYTDAVRHPHNRNILRGDRAIQKTYREALQRYANHGQGIGPLFFGGVGVPMDLTDGSKDDVETGMPLCICKGTDIQALAKADKTSKSKAKNGKSVKNAKNGKHGKNGKNGKQEKREIAVVTDDDDEEDRPGPATLAADRLLRALDAEYASFTWWNYTPENTRAHGDHWNKEDFSIWSADDQKDPDDLHSGGRALAALVRPYAQRIAGDPVAMHFDAFSKEKEFYLAFRDTKSFNYPSVIFVPQYQYPFGVHVEVSDGHWHLQWDEQTLFYWAERPDQDARLDAPSVVHWIRVVDGRGPAGLN